MNSFGPIIAKYQTHVDFKNFSVEKTVIFDLGSTHRLVKGPLGANWCEIFSFSWSNFSKTFPVPVR